MENVRPSTTLLMANCGELAKQWGWHTDKPAQSLGAGTDKHEGTKEFGTWRM